MERSLSLEDCETGKNTHAQDTISEDASTTTVTIQDLVSEIRKGNLETVIHRGQGRSAESERLTWWT